MFPAVALSQWYSVSLSPWGGKPLCPPQMWVNHIICFSYCLGGPEALREPFSAATILLGSGLGLSIPKMWLLPGMGAAWYF